MSGDGGGGYGGPGDAGSDAGGGKGSGGGNTGATLTGPQGITPTSISETASLPPSGGVPIFSSTTPFSAGDTGGDSSGASSAGAAIPGVTTAPGTASFDPFASGTSSFASIADPSAAPTSSGVNGVAQFVANPGAPLGTTAGGAGSTGATAFTAPAGAAPQLGSDPTAALTGGTPTDSSLFNPATTASTSPFAAPGAGGFTPPGSSAVNTVPVNGTTPLTPAQLGVSSSPSSSSGGGLSLESLTQGAEKSINSNPLGLALAGGGLGYSILEGQKQSAANNALTQQAEQANANAQPLIAQGEQLSSYLQSGTLPPGYQSQVDQAIASAKTSAISNAAAQGLSTDPTQNTTLATTLSQIEQQGPILSAQIAQQLLTAGTNLIGTGVSASGLASNVYTTLANIDQTQTAATAKAIANMAAALSGKTSIPGTNLNISTG